MIGAGNILQGERNIREGDQAPAANKVDHPAEDASAGPVAARPCTGCLSYLAGQMGLRNFYYTTNFPKGSGP